MSSKKLTEFFSKTTSSSPPKKQQEQKQEQENNEIVVAEKYHPPENLAFPKSVVQKQQRSCQHHWFKKFTWFHYDIENDSVPCFLCFRAEKKGYVTGELSKEQAYISKVFKSWKKAPKCFTEHEQSKAHTTAKTYEVLVPRCIDVGDMLSGDLKAKRLEQRKYFIKVMECVQYLAHQGIPFLGSNDNKDNFYQLLLLMGKYD